MGKRDSLKFAIKKSLVVGTATATIGATACGPTISNPVPDTQNQDPGDTASETPDGSDADAGDTSSDDNGDADAESDADSS